MSGPSTTVRVIWIVCGDPSVPLGLVTVMVTEPLSLAVWV
jgi:hypothetical protein